MDGSIPSCDQKYLIVVFLNKPMTSTGTYCPVILQLYDIWWQIFARIQVTNTFFFWWPVVQGNRYSHGMSVGTFITKHMNLITSHNTPPTLLDCTTQVRGVNCTFGIGQKRWCQGKQKRESDFNILPSPLCADTNSQVSTKKYQGLGEVVRVAHRRRRPGTRPIHNSELRRLHGRA